MEKTDIIKKIEEQKEKMKNSPLKNYKNRIKMFLRVVCQKCW